MLDLPGLADVDPLTTDTVFDLDDVPGSLAVLGAGPAGCELAQAFARLGTAVTLVDPAERVLPGLDADAGAVVADALRRDGVDLRLGAVSRHVEKVPGGRVRVVCDDSTLEADRLLLVTGRRPATTGLGLDRAGDEVGADGAVRVDRHLATTAPGVFAVGDVTALCPHTHAADEMGRIAVRNAARPAWRRRRFRPHLVPRVVFTDPEVATIGLPEDGAGPGAWVAQIPLSAVDRAVTAGRENGFVRLVAGPLPGTSRLTADGLRRVGGGRLLGATIVAERAGEMIAEVGLAMQLNALTGRLAQTVHAYPTWSLAVRQAAAALATGAGPGVTVRRAGR
jgi:pyruvate/2-oxoglutarate dehydrogenase complex dihydrolipoamide dehydrogenase (E3) component